MQSSLQLGWYRKVNALRKAWVVLTSLDSGDLQINKMVHCWFQSFHRIWPTLFVQVLVWNSRSRTVLGQSLEVNTLRMVESSSAWSSWFRPWKWLKERMTTSLGWASSHSLISISTDYEESTGKCLVFFYSNTSDSTQWTSLGIVGHSLWILRGFKTYSAA